ncbi:hypothetical protein [Deinococcus actinosclerus]|uniref:Uncharacterized protein n=1 Tax=Deinococcus actinosclerus TaxID=1768108 RepID=A0ABM5X5Y8_9DEIO|nr:hypothetical protein [Deinococcus actinosclerus]ALW89206.1 hypothetical protein AUC44_10095 [Deinococcus actinosclerus]
MNVPPSLTHALLPAGTDLGGLGARVARHAGVGLSLRPGDRAREVAFGALCPGAVLFDPQSAERIP